MKEEILDLDVRCAVISDLVEQIERLNQMIELHWDNKHSGDLMIGQYSMLRFRMIEKLKTVFESLHLKVEDTAHYVERFQAEQKATENGNVQAFALAEAA